LLVVAREYVILYCCAVFIHSPYLRREFKAEFIILQGGYGTGKWRKNDLHIILELFNEEIFDHEA